MLGSNYPKERIMFGFDISKCANSSTCAKDNRRQKFLNNMYI